MIRLAGCLSKLLFLKRLEALLGSCPLNNVFYIMFYSLNKTQVFEGFSIHCEMSSKVRSFFWCDFVLFWSWNVVGFSVDIQTKMNVHKMFLRCLRRQMNIIKSNNSLVHWVHISKTASKTIWNVIVTVTA